MCHTRIAWLAHPINEVDIVHSTEDVLALCREVDPEFIGGYPLHRALRDTQYEQPDLSSNGVCFVKGLRTGCKISTDQAFKYGWNSHKVPSELTTNEELLALLKTTPAKQSSSNTDLNGSK